MWLLLKVFTFFSKHSLIWRNAYKEVSKEEPDLFIDYRKSEKYLFFRSIQFSTISTLLIIVFLVSLSFVEFDFLNSKFEWINFIVFNREMVYKLSSLYLTILAAFIGISFTIIGYVIVLEASLGFLGVCRATLSF